MGILHDAGLTALGVWETLNQSTQSQWEQPQCCKKTDAWIGERNWSTDFPTAHNDAQLENFGTQER